MSDLLIRALAVLAIVAGLIGVGYWAGHNAASSAAQTKAIKAEREARQRYDLEVKRGDQAVADLIKERAARDLRFNELQGAFDAVKKRTPLLVARPAAGCPALAVAAAAPGGDATDPTLGAGHRAAPAPGDPGRLTAGAVWMWNSALDGTDQPAGACGASDTSEAACAAETSLDITDAWDNHVLNARLCAEDRLNHQRLIDYLKDRP